MSIPHDSDCPRRHCFTFCGELCDCGADNINSIIEEVTAGFRADVRRIMGPKEKPDGMVRTTA